MMNQLIKLTSVQQRHLKENLFRLLLTFLKKCNIIANKIRNIETMKMKLGMGQKC